MKKSVAIVLAAGQGKRMNTPVAKQYLLLDEKPILAYSLKTFENSFIDEIILVVESGFEEYCKHEIVDKYNITKVKAIVAGGKERYHSVYCGLKCIESADYVYIHDGARPFISNEILERAKESVEKNAACVVGMPVKDTIKIANEKQCVESTPNRKLVWQVQTPQVFSFSIIKEAYDKVMTNPVDGITDDAMVVEYAMGQEIHLVEGSYENIKVTTRDDLVIGEVFSKKYWQDS